MSSCGIGKRVKINGSQSGWINDLNEEGGQAMVRTLSGSPPSFVSQLVNLNRVTCGGKRRSTRRKRSIKRRKSRRN